ncbi:phosphatidate cytidylyltransferase [Thermoleophilia bacterium SCSIO 60948]|nr:phosphatidate cytidylyltransferase [Thermoleophilia bacterium SCSIO 60948]
MEAHAQRQGRGGRLPADLGPRIIVAIPAAAVAIGLLLLGGLAWAFGLAIVGALAAGELFRLLHTPPRFAAVGLAAVFVLPPLAAELGRDAIAAIPFLVVALSFCVALAPGRERVAAGAGAATLAAAWIGIGLAHGAMLRELPHGGALVLDVLLAVFLGDTAAQLGGSAFGRRKLAPSVSPKKSVEGLAFGLVTGPLVVVIAAVGFQDFLEVWQAALLGLVAAIAAPAGDLFESMLKREAAVKDSGGLLGPHGGMLDRIDAALFAAVAGYWLALWLIV